MKLRDLRIVGSRPPPDQVNTKTLLDRVQNFLNAAESSKPPTDFETVDTKNKHIELELLIPKDNCDKDRLILPIDTSSTDSDSSSGSTDSDDRLIIAQSRHNKMYKSSVKCRLPKQRPKIEEMDPNDVTIQTKDDFPIQSKHPRV